MNLHDDIAGVSDRNCRALDEFFIWLAAQAARASRKSNLGQAMVYMLKRQERLLCSPR
ncbi:hypothetical protein SAMN05216328_13734 [Ensifer sp. YR511]|nr:hypothetical protein SAMN05216328_13734 [Ensifer sp. YR511]